MTNYITDKETIDPKIIGANAVKLVRINIRTGVSSLLNNVQPPIKPTTIEHIDYGIVYFFSETRFIIIC